VRSSTALLYDVVSTVFAGFSAFFNAST